MLGNPARKMDMTNPFFYGNPVDSTDFFNRKGPLQRVVGRLVNRGQSTAIISEPRVGKTSLLQFLAAPGNYLTLYGSAKEQLLFSYLDTQTLPSVFTPVEFWVQALAPLREQIVNPEPASRIAQQYHLCRDNHFGTFTLEILFTFLKQAGWRLVLLIDEFDSLLNHPVLNSAEFYGGLRSLSSRSEGALALVIGSRLRLSELNKRTQEFNPTGSPFFNTFAEIMLGAFSERDVAALIAKGNDYFTPQDRQAIRTVAGGHPYLLQVAASAMWDAWEEGIEQASDRRRYVGQRLYQEQKMHFVDTWRVWLPAMRKAFTAVALTHTAQLLPERQFLTQPFIEQMRDWGPELGDLEMYGLLTRDAQVPGGWRVGSQAMLWWLADELVRNVRDDETSFEDWLRAQELDGPLTRRERDQLSQVVHGAVQALRQGAFTLVEAFAKGMGESLAGGGA